VKLLSEVVKILGKNNKCERLVKTSRNEFSLSGATLVAGGLQINFGNFSYRVKKLVDVSRLAIELDETQYLLCTSTNNIEMDKRLRDRCIAIRLQLIIAFNHLRSILSSIDEVPNEQLELQLSKWLEFMAQLHIHSISLLNPDLVAMGPAISLPKIMEYQGIEEKELLGAVDSLR
jgi:hypothetical protein